MVKKYPLGWKCHCGHKRSEHKYRYDSIGRRSSISPCKPCGRVREPLSIMGAYVEGDRCAFYSPQTNLELVEMKYADKTK